MNIRFETTGCRLNQIESESAARAFVEKEFEVIIKPLTAKNEKDLETVLCVINTCAVTQKAEQKDRRMIRLVLEKCPSACVIVTGCYAQLSSKDILSMDERIACLPGQKKSRLSEVPELLKKQISQGFDPVLFAKKHIVWKLRLLHHRNSPDPLDAGVRHWLRKTGKLQTVSCCQAC